MSDFFFDEVVVAFLGVADDEFAEETGYEKQCAKYHAEYCEVEIRTIGNQGGDSADTVREGNEFIDPDNDNHYKSGDKHKTAQQSEEMHGLFAEF